MMTVTEKAAYLKGLVEMAHFDADTDEVKIIKAMVDAIDEMALTIADLEDEVAALTEVVDEIDEDLGDVEECIYDDYCDDDDCCCDDDCCGGDHDDSDYFEVECPACGETLEFDFDDEDDGDDK